MKFDWRKLFITSYYFYIKRHDFNSFLFYIDCLILTAILLSILKFIIYLI